MEVAPNGWRYQRCVKQGLPNFCITHSHTSVATLERVAGRYGAYTGVGTKGRSSSTIEGYQTQGCTVPAECAFALSS